MQTKADFVAIGDAVREVPHDPRMPQPRRDLRFAGHVAAQPDVAVTELGIVSLMLGLFLRTQTAQQQETLLGEAVNELAVKAVRLHPDKFCILGHFDLQSPSAASGRGLSIAVVHDVDGVLVASATQQNLMVHADG